jgi:hypothetical protein
MTYCSHQPLQAFASYLLAVLAQPQIQMKLQLV